MGSYAPGTTPFEPQKRKESRAVMDPERLRPRAEYLATINLSGGAAMAVSAQDFTAPQGAAPPRSVFTEYDLPPVNARCRMT
jgi:hypothetical protein